MPKIKLRERERVSVSVASRCTSDRACVYSMLLVAELGSGSVVRRNKTSVSVVTGSGDNARDN